MKNFSELAFFEDFFGKTALNRGLALLSAVFSGLETALYRGPH